MKILIQRPVKDSDRLFLQRSQCGFDGNDPKVCCPTVTTTPPPNNDGSQTNAGIYRR